MNKLSKIFNRKDLVDTRKKLRNASTSAEAALWNLLKNKQLDGRKFRRQHSINNSIVDFYCHSEKMIIELDGDSHSSYSQIEKDIERDNLFIKAGLKVLRFENRFVFQEPEFVLEEIRNCYRVK
jgi:very-short-patch-repair endonuclease